MNNQTDKDCGAMPGDDAMTYNEITAERKRLYEEHKLVHCSRSREMIGPYQFALRYNYLASIHASAEKIGVKEITEQTKYSPEIKAEAERLWAETFRSMFGDGSVPSYEGAPVTALCRLLVSTGWKSDADPVDAKAREIVADWLAENDRLEEAMAIQKDDLHALRTWQSYLAIARVGVLAGMDMVQRRDAESISSLPSLIPLRVALNTGAGLLDPEIVYNFQVTLDAWEAKAEILERTETTGMYKS